jgi:hypothetical protein
MQKTAIQQAIATIQSSLDSWKDVLEKEPDNAFVVGMCKEKQGAIEYLTTLIPTEQEQIEQAFYDGGDVGCPNGEVGERKAKDYFNKTYKTEE